MSRIGKSEPRENDIFIDVDGASLGGTLTLCDAVRGLVIFAHGSGSSRHSSRNHFVAQTLQAQGVSTLLFDLLTQREESQDRFSGKFRFDISFLAKRLVYVTQWCLDAPETKGLKIGYFGASTGAGAALVAAASLGDKVAAIVSRGGRPDLAGNALPLVLAPTLLIVGGNDEVVLELNREALTKMVKCSEKTLVVVPRATHLFEEPGALEEVARVAAKWFAEHFANTEKMPRTA